VSALVHLYSWGYMSEDPKPAALLRLSLALHLRDADARDRDNLVQMFFGWEGVGLASYLLIGFWYEKPSGAMRPRSRRSSSTASAISASRSASSAPSWCSAPSSIPTILAAAPGMAGATIGFLGGAST
jgi:NADH-quinone oxidoreductase subunit L